MVNFKYKFLFEELVKRDFNKKYKRSFLGVFWSLLSPLLMLAVMSLIFTKFFGRTTPHYTVHLFVGQIVFSFFTEATNAGMSSMVGAASIYSKINIPKYLFIITSNTLALVNFLLTMVILFIFTALDGIPITWKFLLLLYPIICLVLFNIGFSFILSTLFVFFKDVQYLYSVFTRILMYVSAIFYDIKIYDPQFQKLFYLNPIFVYIKYFRTIIIDNTIPSMTMQFLALFYAIITLFIGIMVYRKNHSKFLYYI